MPLSKIADAARKRKERGAEARGQEKVALQSEVMPEVKRSKRSNEDAVFPMNKRNAQRDVTRAAKQIVQDAVFPTSDAVRHMESYEPSSEAHGGSREHAGRPRELSRGQRDYENMVAVATKQRLLWDTQNAAAGDAALGACAPVKLAADGTLQCVHPKHHTCEAALAATPSAKVSRAKKRIFDFKVIFHDSLPKQSCAIKRQTQQPFDNSTKESSLVSGLAAVHRFYEDRNMFRATCVCCSELYAPVCVRTVLIEQGWTWHRRLHGRLSWDHTTFTCSANTVAHTKASGKETHH